MQALISLEQKADAAPLRDRCFLYTEILQRLTGLEGAQVSAGDQAGAALTLDRINSIATKINNTDSKDSAHLKNAEELMDRTTDRLHDMLHLADGQERISMKATLDRLNRLHDQMLNLVFSK